MGQISWESHHYEFDRNTGKLTRKREDGDNDTLQEFNEEIEFSIEKVMQTPMGLWAIDDDMNPFKQFEFWMGHADFPITHRHMHILERVPGVEVLQILTKYRFLIGIGRLFNFREVRLKIEEVLCGRHQSENP